MKASRPIDLPDTGVADLEIVTSPGGVHGQLEVHWRAAVTLTMGIVCRIEDYNLVMFSEGGPVGAEAVGTLDHVVQYRPEPFAVAPDVCEVRVLSKHLTGHQIEARACYLGGVLTRGQCPDGTFSPPKLPDGAAFDVQRGSAHVIRDDDLELKVLFTLGQPLQAPPSFAIRCDGVDSEPDRYDELYELSDVLVGETLYGRHIFHMKHALAPDPKQCELGVLVKGEALATFCIAQGTTQRGRCEST